MRSSFLALALGGLVGCGDSVTTTSLPPADAGNDLVSEESDSKSESDALFPDAGDSADSPDSPESVTCALPPDCDDKDPKTVDIVSGNSCEHEPALGPAAPERMDADFLCEQKKQATCVKSPSVEFFDYDTCARQKEFESPPWPWWDSGYPLAFLYYKSVLPAKKIRLHLTLSVGVLSDRYEAIVYEGKKEVSYGILSAAELEADKLVVAAVPSGDGYWTPLSLRPSGNLAAHAVQFSFEGVTDEENGVFYSAGCDGEKWSVYGLFHTVPRHGILRIGDAPAGLGGCMGTPARRDADKVTKGGFYRTLCDPTVWLVDAGQKTRRAFNGGKPGLWSWLFKQEQYDPVLFCSRDLNVVPDGALDAIPVGSPIGN
ncbi:hypothetical protein EPN90_04190 [Patescibacteria group bacterium]|nr:MAG: hypothetical protein EPN90_04190 [Patescibacteria group bacterium]